MKTGRIRKVRLAALVAVAAVAMIGQQPAPNVPGGLNLNGASLMEVLNILTQDLHLNYIVDPAVRGGTVTINTYGQIRDVDLRPLLETILRMNNLAMVQTGNIYRIVPAASIPRQPLSPMTETDPGKIPEDERMVMNLLFLRYVTSSELIKILQPFMGDGGQIVNYDPANLLIVLDNSRNMRRTLEMVRLFDNDTFASQRVRSFDVRFGRPSDVTKELDEIFRAYALAGDKGGSPIKFLAIDRINTILAISPNPSSFDEVAKWLVKIDIPAKVTVGAVDNYVYKLRYQRAEVLGAVVGQLYGTGSFAAIGAGLYGGTTGNSTYPANSYIGGGQSAGYTNTGMPQAFGAASLSGGSGGAIGGTTGAVVPGFPQTGTAPGLAAGGIPGQTADRTGTFLGASPFGQAPGQPYTGPRIIANPFDNTLLVQGTPQQWEQVKHLLEQLDVSPRQVLIDAKIYEVDLTGSFSAGVESFLQSKGAALPSGTSTNFVGSALSSGLSLSAGELVSHSKQLLGVLQASDSKTRARVLSAPSIIATDSIPASITVGSSVPVLTSESINGITQGGTSQFTNTISNASTGIGLNILARISPSGVVTMVINQNITAPVPNPTDSSINSPSFSQRNVSTQVTVEDGDTVAIGGIITENSTDTSAGIPFLHRIPGLGAAFGSKTYGKQRTELIVFLTPRVIYDTTRMADATDELREKVKGLARTIEKDEKSQKVMEKDTEKGSGAKPSGTTALPSGERPAANH